MTVRPGARFPGTRLTRVPNLQGLAQGHPERFPFLLDSAASGPLGRLSILFYREPEAPVLQLDENGLAGPGAGTGFLDRLRSWYLDERQADGPTPPTSFVGGWFVYLGYELAGEIEPKLQLPASPHSLPTALAVRCRGAVVVRHGSEPMAWVVAEDEDLRTAIMACVEPGDDPPVDAVPELVELTADPADQFVANVGRIREYLLDGDVFQVNVSRCWRGRFQVSPNPLAVYASLRRTNPAPFAGLMRWQGATLLSSSPERLVEVVGRAVQTRPIAGTRPRDPDPGADRALSDELIGHPKERAEHIMLIDLERNDLGRVCRPGSIEVNELMVVESYAHVHHIVSNVRGLLREGATPIDAARAVFPGGTITGCPKVRCMEIIAELEGVGRGFYTGAMGYLGRDGRMDLNILIRSMLLENDTIAFRTGAGIVHDSVAEAEVRETEDKARGLLLALGRERPMPA